MSFESICPTCGAPSGPSVGICPYCKSVMVSTESHDSVGVSAFIKCYNEGKLERALALGNSLYKTKPELKNDMSFLLMYVKVLLESEGPSSQMRSILGEASLLAPDNAEILDYLEILEAKSHLKRGVNDAGELMLKSILRRSPRNIHAHFILGAHIFWTDQESAAAIPHLETCVRLNPNFLRAWGCLGAIYKKMGNVQLAQSAFNKCATLETNAKMKDFFLTQAKAG